MVKASKGGARGGGVRGAGGERSLSVRVKTAKGRKLASTRWLQRQLNDPYVEAAKRAGYRSRAAFKLAEIDDRHRLLRPGMTVVDLGSSAESPRRDTAGRSSTTSTGCSSPE